MSETMKLEQELDLARAALKQITEKLTEIEEKLKKSYSANKTSVAVAVGVTAVAGAACAYFFAPVATTFIAAKAVVAVTGVYMGLKLLGALFFGPWVLAL